MSGQNARSAEELIAILEKLGFIPEGTYQPAFIEFLLADAAAEERARIVEWLRSYADDGLARSYADAIEKGEHLR